MSGDEGAVEVRVSEVIHDLPGKRSLVTLTWPEHTERKLRLPIPFGTELDQVHAEAERALRAHEASIRKTSVASA